VEKLADLLTTDGPKGRSATAGRPLSEF
jgi:hypothetical protein